jgi:cystathionine gamma-synthase
MIPLIVDDTVGSVCNVDLLGVADIVITSLTKSFSGYADVMGGSAVLKKDSPLYAELKPIFDADYQNNLYQGDAATLLYNSSSYLERSATTNRSALKLVNYLQALTLDPTSSVATVYYPTLSPTLGHYDAFKRPTTRDFTPGYGCLFSVGFESLDQTIAFYNNLHVHQGPHIGAHRTLALAYVKATYGNHITEVEAWGLRDTQIRISVGLEDTEVLLATIKHALRFADAVKSGAREHCTVLDEVLSF